MDAEFLSNVANPTTSKEKVNSAKLNRLERAVGLVPVCVRAVESDGGVRLGPALPVLHVTNYR